MVHRPGGEQQTQVFPTGFIFQGNGAGQIEGPQVQFTGGGYEIGPDVIPPPDAPDFQILFRSEHLTQISKKLFGRQGQGQGLLAGQTLGLGSVFHEGRYQGDIGPVGLQGQRDFVWWFGSHETILTRKGKLK